MSIYQQEEPEGRRPIVALSPPASPALPAADESEGDEAQWEAYLTERTLLQYGECAGGCDWTDGALSSDGCRW